MSSQPTTNYPLWTRGDLDGFFGLMVDNLVQVLLITTLCTTVVGIPAELVFSRILPGVAVSLLIGNLFYGWQARRVARRTKNPDCTALPYGINTPSVFAYTLFVMAPAYSSIAGSDPSPETAARAAEVAWLAGIAACLVGGLVEFGGAFVAEWLRRVTPRAALLGVLAAVGITFIASDFAFRLYSKPLFAMLPLGILLLAYFARFRFPFALPGGFLAVLFGTLIAWAIALVGEDATLLGTSVSLAWQNVTHAAAHVGWTPPQFYGDALATLLNDQSLVPRFLAVSIPMGILNLLGALQNIESAAASGDRYHTASSLSVNGLGTLAAGCCGSCFPTTIYIGHPGWKALGARSSYSIVNGLFFTLCFLFGLGPLLAAIIPIEAGAAIVMYIGIIITAQAFQTTPREHAPAVAIALFPALAAMLVIKMADVLRFTNPTSNFADLMQNTPEGLSTLPGLLALTGANSGWILVTLIVAALTTALIDRRFVHAAIWSATAAVLTLLGLIHAYQLDAFNNLRELFVWQAPAEFAEYVYRPWSIALSYGLMMMIFLAADWRVRRRAARRPPPDTAANLPAAAPAEPPAP